MTNGSIISGFIQDVEAEHWSYSENAFTVDAADAGTATAVWTVSQNGRKATVTLTLTGATTGATYGCTVSVSPVTAA